MNTKPMTEETKAAIEKVIKDLEERGEERAALVLALAREFASNPKFNQWLKVNS